jgi:hypothetical protein
LRRWRAALVASVVVMLAAGCQVDATLELVVDDGGGAVSVVVLLDAEAAERVPDLDERLRVDDLAQAGWEVTGPQPGEDGSVRVAATKPFANPEEAEAVLGEVTGPQGPLREIDVAVEHPFGRRHYRFSAVADFSAGLAVFSDPGLTELLGGEPVGFSAEELEALAGGDVADALDLEVRVRLPGDVSANARASEGGMATWTPSLADPGPTSFEASSRTLDPLPLGLAALALVAGLAFLFVLARRVVGRS